MMDLEGRRGRGDTEEEGVATLKKRARRARGRFAEARRPSIYSRSAEGSDGGANFFGGNDEMVEVK
jgi:hypothetical protein